MNGEEKRRYKWKVEKRRNGWRGEAIFNASHSLTLTAITVSKHSTKL